MSEPRNLIEWLTAELDRALASKVGHGEKAALLAYADRRWRARYARFQDTEGASETPHPVYGPPDATDFVLILAEISKRRAALTEQVPA